MGTEYPKVVYFPDGSWRTAKTAEEEANYLNLMKTLEVEDTVTLEEPKKRSRRKQAPIPTEEINATA